MCGVEAIRAPVIRRWVTTRTAVVAAAVVRVSERLSAVTGLVAFVVLCLVAVADLWPCILTVGGGTEEVVAEYNAVAYDEGDVGFYNDGKAQAPVTG